MKVSNQRVIVLLLVIVAVSVACLSSGLASASSGPSFQASVIGKSYSVRQETSYVISISNTGTINIGSVNVTVPSGYSNLADLVVTSPASQNWKVTLETEKSNYFILVYGSSQGLSSNQSITFTFNARNPLPANNYKWVVGVSENTTSTGTSIPQSFTSTHVSSIVITSLSDALLIVVIALVIAFINTALNRVLINYFVGWEQYRVMQKEMNEYRQETMAAARANDKKQMEKLKKRQSQINAMQAKMLKPQMVQLGISFLYIFIWIFVLTPTYGITSMVYLPGFGALPVVYWYPIVSFFLGLLASRILGIMPIEP
ncbi:MAG TPA: EMC3/TMCO1 family protein [Candidatus Limnocylindrales bacterium]|nr:EMC3/TMCO1 family protein [Candidatus Limnocylindrales bacterium]